MKIVDSNSYLLKNYDYMIKHKEKLEFYLISNFWTPHPLIVLRNKWKNGSSAKGGGEGGRGQTGTQKHKHKYSFPEESDKYGEKPNKF